MMERRLEASKKQAEQIVHLEDQVSKFKKQEQMFEETTKQLDAEIDALYKQNEVLKSQTASQEAQRKPALFFGMGCFTDLDPLSAAAQQNEPDDMRMEGNLETWALLERVRFLLFAYTKLADVLYRLRHCGELSASCVWRTLISKAKTCYAKSRPFPRFLCRSPEHLRLLWILPEHPIRTRHRHRLIQTTMRSLPLLLPLRRLRVRQGDFTGM